VTPGGRTVASRAGLVDRIATVVLVLACGWFAFTVVWGMGGVPAAGHIGGGTSGTFLAAEHMVRWRIPYPVRAWYSPVHPEGNALMCHHPYGIYYLPALLYILFGHHDALLRIPMLLESIPIPWLLYLIGRERGGHSLGAVAAAAYVVVPIAVGFSAYYNLETICIFGLLLFFWGHTRHMTTGRSRYLAASLAGLVVVCSGDWIGYVLVAPTLGWAFFRMFVLPARLTPRFRLGPYARWWALSVVIGVVLLCIWIGLFAAADQIPQWLSAEDNRGGGKIGNLAESLHARKGWLEFSFTPLAIAIGKLAVPVCVGQFLARRRDEETYALGILFGATVQYIAFKKGADVHIFWPHYYAAYFALALAQLCEVAGDAAVRIVRRYRPAPAGLAAGVALAIGLAPVVAMAHDGVASLWVWRRTGGRFDEHGNAIRSQVDVLYVIQQVLRPHMVPGTTVDAPKSLGWGWEYVWSAQAQNSAAEAPAVGTDVSKHPFWLARASGLSGGDERKIAATSHVRAYGDAWVVDQREPWAPMDAYSLHEREPSPFEWLFYGGTDRMRSIGSEPDPWKTWEWRVHLDQPAVAPPAEPRTLDEVRIAYDVAVAADDSSAAARWRAGIESALDRRTAAVFTHGVRMLGTRMIDGVEPRVECWFELGDEAPGDWTFEVRSSLTERATLSLIPPESTDRAMSFPPSLATKLWRRGFIYETEAVLNHRIGRERYTGAWRSRDGSAAPRRADGLQFTLLAELP
jgi:hypothetical protein